MSRILSITKALRRAIRARQAGGETITSIAEGAGMRQPHISRFLAGGYDMKGRNIDRLAKYLKLELREKHQ